MAMCSKYQSLEADLLKTKFAPVWCTWFSLLKWPSIGAECGAPTPIYQGLPITWSPVDMSLWEHWCKPSTWSRSRPANSCFFFSFFFMGEIVWYFVICQIHSQQWLRFLAGYGAKPKKAEIRRDENRSNSYFDAYQGAGFDVSPATINRGRDKVPTHLIRLAWSDPRAIKKRMNWWSENAIILLHGSCTVPVVPIFLLLAHLLGFVKSCKEILDRALVVSWFLLVGWDRVVMLRCLVKMSRPKVPKLILSGNSHGKL